MAGVSSSGFERKTDGDLTADLQASFRAVYGQAVNVDPRSRIGQFIAIFSDKLSEVWGVAEALASSMDPASAMGVLLDNLSALTGTVRKAATKSAVQLIATGDDTTLLATGRRAKVTGTTTIFETLADATLTAATAWAAATSYALDDIISSDGSIWVCIEAGTSGSSGPEGAGDVVDGSVTWRWVGDGLAYALVDAEASVTGPLQGYAGSITTIDTPVSGWSGVNNLLDAVPGTNVETDAELRARRVSEISSIGSSPLPAVQAALLRVSGVTSCTVFENTTDVTVDSITPHAIEALVEGAADADIRAALFASKAAGIETCGGVSGTVADSNGNGHTIKFSRPSTVDIYVDVVLVKDRALYPLDGDAQVKAAIVAAGDARGLGLDVVASRISGDIFRSVPGVLDVTSVKMSTAPSPSSSATIAISLRQRADYDTSRINVASTNGVP